MSEQKGYQANRIWSIQKYDPKKGVWYNWEYHEEPETAIAGAEKYLEEHPYHVGWIRVRWVIPNEA